MTQKGRDLLIQLEGCKLQRYKDPAGLPSIGIGHQLTKSELTSGKIRMIGGDIDIRQPITEAQAFEILELDLKVAHNAVASLVKVPLTDTQFDALVSFAFNTGVGAFGNSTLLKKLNTGDYAAVPEQMRRWVYAAGKKLKGLVNRREAEIKLWETT